MTITIEAIYESGVLKPLSPLPYLKEHERVRITLEVPSIAELAFKGKPGILTGTALRFCYGSSPRLSETLPLLDVWGKFWDDARHQPHETGGNRFPGIRGALNLLT